VDRTLLPAVADASPAKQGLRMPGTDILSLARIGSPQTGQMPYCCFLADLLTEARAAFFHVEATGGRWVNVETLGQGQAEG
jgi:hypothetical protein